MSFDTVTFWLFFAVAWTVWRFAPFALAKSATLVLSLVFYAWWNPWYVPLILLSSAIDFQAGARIHAASDPKARRRWLWVSLASNLGLLAVFKYAPFAVNNASSLAAAMGYDVDWSLAGWIVPVGISFYTFQTLSYSLDIYFGRLKPVASWRDFALFVAFFPQLVAGPIVRATELLPQFEQRRKLLPVGLQAGLYHVILGLFLKIVVADNLAAPVGRVFESVRPESITPAEAWLATIYFGVQIFADFAGYSGIAIGLAYLMGLRFPVNFNFPYIARGLSEFWTRWHITLSQWLRDYLYIPLGGNRGGPGKTYRNLMLTMLLGGLWHGASWTFVAWGAMHGTGLSVERFFGERFAGRELSIPSWVTTPLRIVVVYVFVQATWVLFRAQDFATAAHILERMFIAPFRVPFGGGEQSLGRYALFLIPVAWMHAVAFVRERRGAQPSTWWRAAAAATCVLAMLVFERTAAVQFIYFQF